ncbi:MAG TPA: hypothetical protein VMH38_01780 [Thermoplasmata archaeon]|nr:hypothetical protein [Thermoplasmata archaeon]
MARVFKSKVGRTKARSESLRTTIPEAVAAILGVGDGDTLAWVVEPGGLKVGVSKYPPR